MYPVTRTSHHAATIVRGTGYDAIQDVSASTLGPHNDSMPAELFGAVYLQDVPAHSGGTTIWPGSPQMLYDCFDTEHQCGFTPNGTYKVCRHYNPYLSL